MSISRESFKTHLREVRKNLSTVEYVSLRRDPDFLLKLMESGFLQFLTKKQQKIATQEYVRKSAQIEAAFYSDDEDEKARVERMMIEEGQCPTRYTSVLDCPYCGKMPVPPEWPFKAKCPWCDTNKRLAKERVKYEENGSPTMQKMLASAPRVVAMVEDDEIPW